MRRITITLALCAVGGLLGYVLLVNPPASVAPTTPEEPARGVVLISAIEWVESRGNATAEGEDDEVGILQIRPIMVEEVNRIVGRQRFTLDDRLDPEKSREMFWIYTDHWNLKRHDHSDEGIARRWNGGPNGHNNTNTLDYWNRVAARIRTVGG